MKQYNIGDRLPDPYYERAIGKRFCSKHIRRCEVCEHKWTTSEIPLVKTWRGEDAKCCPVHIEHEGKPLKHMSCSVMAKGNHDGKSVWTIYSWGGIYRRRECNFAYDLLGKEKCFMEQKIGGWMPTRWTTAEVSADGLVVEDIMKCVRCGGRGKMMQDWMWQRKERDDWDPTRQGD